MKSTKDFRIIGLNFVFLLVSSAPVNAGKFGLYFGLTSSRVSIEGISIKSDGPLSRVAPSGGLTYRVSKAGILSFEPGIFILSLGAKEDWSLAGVFDVKVVKKNTYLDLPLIVVLKPPATRIALEAGGSVSWPLSNKTTSTTTLLGNIPPNTPRTSIQDTDNTKDALPTASMIGGVRYYFPVPRISPHIVLRVQYGGPVIKKQDSLETHNLSFSLFAGINL